jgi:endonuclease/exonuclease/phosphatase family metal-dependent hydrolase
MIPLFIPWLLLFFLAVFILFVVLRKWKYALSLFVVIVSLNWWAECFPIHFYTKAKNRECLKVMSFNINATVGDFAKKASGLVEIIIKYNPDVLFVSELSDKNKPILDSLLMNALPYNTHTMNYWNSFYSRLPIRNWERMEKKENVEHLGVYSCNISFANDSIVFYGCHFASNNYTLDKKYVTPDSINNHHDVITYISDVETAYSIRRKEANIVGKEIKKAVHPVILMGDLNDVSGSATVRTLECSGLQDAWWKGGLGYGATMHIPLPFRIDHIMFSDKLKLRYIEVVNSEGFSDHDALYAEFGL